VSSNAHVTFEHEDPRADVLVVTSGWPNETNETYCVFIKRQVESLIERGLRCDVVFIRGYRSRLAYVSASLKLTRWSLSRSSGRYKLVHAHGGEAALAAAFYPRAPLLVSYLGSDLLGDPRSDGSVPLRGRIRRLILRQHSRLTVATITKSLEMEESLPGAVRARNTVLPNGVDTNLFSPMDREAARNQLGWDSTARVALFAANPDLPRKRYWLAQEAVEAARAVLPDLRLEVATGTAPDKIPLLMNAADCLLLTSSIEGSPNVAKEALMCNLPVISTAAGDVAELLDGIEPSYVCEPTSASISAALVACLSEPRRSNGRENSRRLDARVIAESLLLLYKRLAPELRLDSGETTNAESHTAGALFD
jgi:teichuronic acid biosynthesis glycosyltransferase TuaC